MKNNLVDNSGNEFEIKVARSIEEVEEMRAIWEGLQHHPNADIDFYLTIIGSRKEVLRPHVILHSSKSGSNAMVIGRVEEKALDFKIGYKTIYSPKVRLLTIVYGGLLGDMVSPVGDILISELTSVLKKWECDLIYLSNLDVDSFIYRLSKSKPGFLSRDRVSKPNTHWKVEIPSNIEVFLAKIKSKHRYWLRRISKILESEFPNRVKIKVFDEQSSVERFCEDIEAVAKKTYQRGLGAGFILDEEHIRRFSLLAKKGSLGVYIMYIDDNPCAYWVGTQFKDVFYLDYTGYDPAFKKYEIGTILTIKMIEDLCKRKIKMMDFGFGDASYKQHFGDSSWEEDSVFIFAPTLRGVKLNTIHFICNGTVRIAKWALKNKKLLMSIKKRWRERLILKGS